MLICTPHPTKRLQAAPPDDVDPFEAAFYQEIGMPLPRDSKKKRAVHAAQPPLPPLLGGPLGRGWGEKGSNSSLKGLGVGWLGGGPDSSSSSWVGGSGQRRGSSSGVGVGNEAHHHHGTEGLAAGGASGAASTSGSVDGHGVEGQAPAARCGEGGGGRVCARAIGAEPAEGGGALQELAQS